MQSVTLQYIIKLMIKSFKHKGLKLFFENGDVKGINPDHAKKLRIILNSIDFAEAITDLNFPQYRLHKLKGDFKNHWSIHVNGNYKITFKFEEKNAYILDYQDYH